MNDYDILQELITILDNNGVAVRREPLAGGGGGLCSVKGKVIFFLDTESPSGENATNAARAVNKIVDVESLYIRPQVRDFLQNYTDSQLQ